MYCRPTIIAPPRSTRPPSSLDRRGERGQFVSGGMTLIPTMKQRLAAPSDLVDLAPYRRLKGITVDGASVTDRRGARPIPRSRQRRSSKASARRSAHLAGHDRRSACAPHGHDRRLGRQQRSGRRLSGGDAGARRDDRHQQARDRGRRFLHRPVRDGAGGRRDRHRRRFEAPEKAGYAKFPNPASRYAMTGVFVASRGGDVRVAVTGAGDDGVFRAHRARGEALASRISMPRRWTAPASMPATLMSDIHASAEYRANLVVVMAKRAVPRRHRTRTATPSRPALQNQNARRMAGRFCFTDRRAVFSACPRSPRAPRSPPDAVRCGSSRSPFPAPPAAPRHVPRAAYGPGWPRDHR